MKDGNAWSAEVTRRHDFAVTCCRCGMGVVCGRGRQCDCSQPCLVADPLLEMGSVGGSQDVWHRRRVVRWCWLSLLSHLAVKKHSIKEQWNTWTIAHVCDCCSIRGCCFLFAHGSECSCTYHSVGKAGLLHQGLELKPWWTWPNQNTCCCPELRLT